MRVPAKRVPASVSYCQRALANISYYESASEYKQQPTSTINYLRVAGKWVLVCLIYYLRVPTRASNYQRVATIASVYQQLLASTMNYLRAGAKPDPASFNYYRQVGESHRQLPTSTSNYYGVPTYVSNYQRVQRLHTNTSEYQPREYQ